MRITKLLVDAPSAETLLDFLMDEGALSVSLEDADNESPDEQPLYGEPGLEPETQAWPRSIVSILYDETTDFDVLKAVQSFQAQGTVSNFEVLSDEALPDEDWVRKTQAAFQPIEVSKRFWVVPSWHELPDPQAYAIRLDPGVAFGTGSHPTTHLCLQWIDEQLPAECSVLDYGCGTGILAIGAKMLGAREVFGCDIDEQAVEASCFNAQENHVDIDFSLPDGVPNQRYDVVIANILCNPLIGLAPTLLKHLKDDGTLVLSGILQDQAQGIIDFYQAQDANLTLSIWRQEEGWVCITGQRRHTPPTP